MSVSTNVTVQIKSADLKGSATIEYVETSLLQASPIVIRWAGNTLSFNTVTEFKDYVNTVLFPTINTVFNTDGAGTGGSTLPSPYLASTSTIVN